MERAKEGPELRDASSGIRAISSERGLDLAWRREVLKTSIRALLSVAVTGREGFNGNQNQQRAISSKRGIGYREESLGRR
jgi:hypothetical protein